MLIPRLITAMILIPLVIIGLFWLPFDIYALTIIVICGLATWEWTQFFKYQHKSSRFVFVALVVGILVGLYYFVFIEKNPPYLAKTLLISSLIWWIIACYLVITYPKSTIFWTTNRLIKYLFCFFTLLPFFIGMMQLRAFHYDINPFAGAYLVLYVFVLVWATDSGAYFVGRSLGKHKLAPNVSPGKTIEGLLGGTLFAIIIALVVYFADYLDINFMAFIISSFFAIWVSILGDLTESMFKREAGIKDSGHLIPGHGGILDRIDSLTSAIPVFTVLSLYLL